ncbi:cystatin-B-like [Poecilia reticulata]|uniref:cystatin-B-like n=1 Tax=Poecilia reticulata TaxID=8081 RepID=UPI0004A3E124|nr:PREDICTED: cystatin-B-like [Poecilia reticulata]
MDVPEKKWSDVKFVTDNIQELCDKVKRKVEEQTQKEFKEYKAVFYRVLDILVLHYVIKVYVGGEYLHLWVIQCASTGEQLMGVQQHHKWNDPLKPFDENN